MSKPSPGPGQADRCFSVGEAMINFRDLLAFLNPIWHAQQHAGMGLVYLFPSGDTSGAKDYAAISAALSVYQTVVLTDGSYYFNQGITVPCHKSLKGVSQNVVLNFTPITAYTALQITASANTTFSEYGPFQLVSLASVPGSIGVALNGSASVLTTVVYGVTLNRIKTYQFDLGFYARTALHTKMLKCSAFGASGVVIDGQCVDFVADDFYAYLQAAVFGATLTINGGVKTGIVVQSYNYGAAGTQRPEDVHFNHPQVLGAAKGINWITCLYGSLFAPVMDYITDIGIYVGNYDGGLQIKNLYVGLSGTSAEYGLLSEYKAAAPAGYLDIDGAA